MVGQIKGLVRIQGLVSGGKSWLDNWMEVYLVFSFQPVLASKG